MKMKGGELCLDTRTFLWGLCSLVFVISAFCSGVNGIDTTTKVPEPTTTVSTTTVSPIITSTTATTNISDCWQHSGNCKACVSAKGEKCAYCTTTKKCLVYKTITDFDCEVDGYYVNECFASVKTLAIALACVGGFLLISSCLVVYCCCCRRKKQRYVWEDAQRERERETRRVKTEERKREREAKYDDIRQKYAIFKSGDPPYTRFDA